MIKYLQFAFFLNCWSFGIYIWIKPVFVFTLALGPLYFGLGQHKPRHQIWTVTWEDKKWEKMETKK